MNIVQAYTKFREQMIILVSGFSGSGKTKISKFLSKLFQFKYVKLTEFRLSEQYYDKDENYVTLKNDIKVLNWDNIYASIDWNKFNDTINNNKKNGVIVDGFGFPTKLLNFEPDFHIHIKINKKKLLEKREKYVNKKNINRDIELDKTILNQITYPIYMKLNEEPKIKFINTNDVSDEKVKEDAFTYLMHAIDTWLQNRSTQTRNKNGDDINASNYQSQKPKFMKKNEVGIDLKYDTSTGKNNITRNNKKPKPHYEGDSYVYDEFYYPDKKRVLYDFNDEGIDYPDDYRKKNDADKESDSSSDSDSNSDATYLFTTDGPKSDLISD